MPRKNRRLIYSGNGDAYYVSPSAIGSSELSVTTPEVFVTANPDDVARGNAQRWWREHGNVYGEKGLEQVSPEFDIIGLAPLVKPIVNTGLRSASRILNKAGNFIRNNADNTARRIFPSYDLYKTVEEATPQVSLGYDALLRNYSKIGQVVPPNETSIIGWGEAAKPSVNWDTDNWFKTISGRTSYSKEEAAELASHVPEYKDIEKRLFDEGKLIVGSDGRIVVNGSEMSPQEYIMRQSKAFQKMNPNHHYTGVSKPFRNRFENSPRDISGRYDVWADRKSPKNVEEYATHVQGGTTIDGEIENVKHRMSVMKNNHEYVKESLKERLERGDISQTKYDSVLKEREEVYNYKLSDAQKEIEDLMKLKAEDPYRGGKVFDITYPKDAVETPIIDAEGKHWTSIPFENVVRDAPDVVSHYASKDINNIALDPTNAESVATYVNRPIDGVMSTDKIVSAAKRNGYGVVHINNVMDSYDGTLLNETIIGDKVPVKSVLGNTGSFDTEGPNKHMLYRGLALPLGIGLAAYNLNQKRLGGRVRFEIGGPIRKPMPPHPRKENREKDPAAYAAYEEWQKDIEQRNKQKEIEAKEASRRRAERNKQAADKLNRKSNVVMSSLESQTHSVPFTSEEVHEAVEKQKEDKLNTWRPIINMADVATNAVGIMSGNPWILGAAATPDIIQAIDNAANEGITGKDLLSLGFDGLGILGATNLLKPLKYTYRQRTTNRFGLPIERDAEILYGKYLDGFSDYGGKLWGIKDGADDAVDLWEVNKRITPDTQFYLEPFKKRYGGKVRLLSAYD